MKIRFFVALSATLITTTNIALAMDLASASQGIYNFDFVAPVVANDTVPPKQAGLIFFNASAGAFQGFNTSGTTLTLSGSGTSSAFTWSGYQSQCTGWGFTSVTYADPADNASCTLTQRLNSGFGTVSVYGAAKPGITFTAAKTGIATIYATFPAANNSSSVTSARMMDNGSLAVLAESVVTGSTTSSMTLVGQLSVTASTSYTVKLQGANSGGANTSTIGASNLGAASVPSVEWKVILQ